MKPAHDMTPTTMAWRPAMLRVLRPYCGSAYDACWLTLPGIVRPLPISYAVRVDVGYE